MPEVWRQISSVGGANAFECVGRCLWVWAVTYDTNVRIRAKSEQ